ncbi:MAG: HYR domain-containing protein [Bacteroidia bacterium]|nr:HYR domain-containing protein [Bacteroidia bacterium]
MMRSLFNSILTVSRARLSKSAGLLAICLSILFLSPFGATFAQEVNVDNAVINIPGGTFFNTDGGVVIDNSGGMDNGGTVDIKGNWINNANGLINGSSGTVVLSGGNETIGGSTSTTFNNLTLQGSGVKTLAVDATVTNTLALNDRELATDVYTIYMVNPATGAITWTTGFISSLLNGGVSRVTAAVSTYVFPVGAAGRFRPVEVTPSVSSTQTYEVRMANVDPNAEGYPRSVNDGSQIAINDQFYHQITRTSGSNPADVSIYFDPGTDGNFTNMVHWQGQPRWEDMNPTTAVTGFGMSGISKSGWNNFSPFALSIADLVPPSITCPSDITVNNDPNNCSARVCYPKVTGSDDNAPLTPAGYTFIGTFGGNYYYVSNSGTDYLTARAQAIAAGGHVATVGSSAENSFLLNGTSGDIWLGFTDEVVEGTFVWETCEPVTYTNWNTGEPNNAGNEDYLHMYTSGLWNDRPSGGLNLRHVLELEGGVRIDQTAGLGHNAVFPLGTTINTFVATDAVGNTSTCSFNVTVVDVQAPVVTCPANITVNNDAGQCGANVTYTAPTVTDNCSGGGNGSQTFNYTGSVQTWTVPAGVFSINVDLFGAQGGTSPIGCSSGTNKPGGLGGRVQATVSVVPGDVLSIYVGGKGGDDVNGSAAGGFNGGGNALNESQYTYYGGGGGGGATDIRLNGVSLNDRILVAGGGGGGGSDGCNCNPLFGGAGGGLIGAQGEQGLICNCPPSGLGGDQSGGGAAGDWGCTCNATAGTFGQGGNSNSASCGGPAGAAGGGGGWYGGGGGGLGAGGGGSSYTIATATNVIHTQGTQSGNGLATISYQSGPSISQTAGGASGTFFSVGTTNNNFTGMDASGNTASCSFSVTVIDAENPTISCPANQTLTATSAAGAVATYTAPSGSDNCPGALTSQTAGLSSGSTFPIGTTTNTFTVTDANGHTASCSFTVNVSGLAPQIVCPSNISVFNAPGQCSNTVTFAATDNVGIPPSTITYSQNPGSSFNVGTTTVTATATNAVGSTSCSFTVTVIDNENPTITCPANITTNVSSGTLLASYPLLTNLTEANNSFAAANLTGNPTPPSVPTSGNPLCQNGIYQNDVGGQNVLFPNFGSLNTNNFTFEVDFRLSALPASNPGYPVVIGGSGWRWLGIYVSPTGLMGIKYNNSNTAFSTTTLTTNVWYTGKVSFSGGVATLYLNGTQVGSFNTGALSTGGNLNFTTNDFSNAKAFNGCIRNFNLYNGGSATCDAQVGYTVTGTDNCGSPTISLVNGIASGGSFPLGTTTNTYSATDPSGNSVTCSFDVTVIDNIDPTITCPSNQTLIATSAAGAAATFATPSGSDNCPGFSVAQTAGLASGSTFPIGTTTNTFTVTDGSGNTASCSFTVQVSGAAPAIVCPANITVSNDPGQCSTAVTFSASDPAGIPPSTITYSNAPGSVFQIGTTTVTATATNAVGSSNCSFTITVVDNEAPSAVCQNVTVQLDASGEAELGNFTNSSVLFSEDWESYPASGGTTSVPNWNVLAGNVDIFSAPSYTAMAGGKAVDLDGTNASATIETQASFNLVAGQTYLLHFEQANNGFNNSTDNRVLVTVGNYSEEFVSPTDLGVEEFCHQIVLQPTSNQTVKIRFQELGTSSSGGTIIDNISLTEVTGSLAIDGGSSDNCGPVTLSTSQSCFSCEDVGPNSVILTVTDASGNTSTCTATVTVEDNIPPVALCQDVTVQLDASGNGSITAQAVDNGSNDACGIQSLSVNPNTFNCSNVTSSSQNFAIDLDASVDQVTIPNNSAYEFTTGTVEAWLMPRANGNNRAYASMRTTVGGTGTRWSLHLNEAANSIGLWNGSSFQTIGFNFVPNTWYHVAAVMTTSNTQVFVNGISIGFTGNGLNAGALGKPLVIGSPNDPGYTHEHFDGMVDDFRVWNDARTQSEISANMNACLSGSEANLVACFRMDEGTGTTIGDLSPVGATGTLIDNAFFNTPSSAPSCATGNAVTLTVTDNNGNTNTCSANVTVEDNIAPVALCQNLTVQLDASGNASITAQDVNNGSSDACGIASLSISQSTFTCQNITTNNVVTLSVTDNNGNSSTCTGTISILDTVPPVAVCQNITIQLDNNGNASITAQDIDNGSTDACGISGYASSQVAFDCDDINTSPNQVTLTVTDVNGNSSTCTSGVTVEDQIPPLALCQDITVSLDATGNVSIAGGQVDGGSVDNCTIQFITVSPPNTFDCNNIGANVVTLAVVDVNNNYSICTANVTIEDNTPPVAICKDITVQLSSGGTVSIAGQDVDNSSTDACGIQSYAVSPSSFDCSDQGSNSVTLTVTDVNGNSSTCNANVRVEDNVDPVAICQDVTVQLDANGNASTTAQAVDNGSNDACGIVSLSLDVTSFDCSDLGANTVTLTVTDGSTTGGGGGGGGQQLDQSQTTTTTRKATLWQSFTAGVTGQLTQIDLIMHASSTTNTKNLNIYAGAGTGGTQLSGPQTLTFSTNSVFESFTLSTPIPVVAGQVYTISLVGFTSTRISYAAGTNPYAGGEMDVVGGLDDLAFRTYVTTTGGSNGNSPNTATCTATVTVQDNIPPTISCPPTQNLIATSAAGATATFTNPVGTDNCPSTTAQTAGLPSGSTFPIGSTTNTFTVTDASGNTASCSFDINVVGVPPAIVCPADITVNTTTGQCDGVATYIATDPVGIPASTITYTIAPGSTFPLGSTTVTATATNSVGSSSCSFIVTVEDHEAPVALCQDMTIQLSAGTNNGDGSASITATQVDNGSNDACGIASLVLDNTSFDCSDVSTSPNTVTLTVTDNNGNQSTCTAGITVEDNVPPVALCQDLTIQLSAGTNNGDGAASITPQQVEIGSSDNCSVANLALDNTSFDCSDVSTSPNTVTLTVTDVNGNQSTCTAGITVQDNVPPVALCQDLTIQLSAGTNNGDGAASITPQQVDNGSSDNCTVASLALDNSSFDCSDVSTSPNTVTLTVTDVNGNQSTCTAGITVEDNVPPVALCQDLTIQLSAGTNNGDGAASITPQQVDNGSSDNCSVANLALDNTSFDCSDVSTSPNTVTLTVTDVNGNQSTCTAGITVEDNVPPVALCQDLTIQLSAGTNNGDGAASITPQQVDNGSSDNCSVASLSLDNTSFNCSDVSTSPNTVTLTVTDVNGNQSTCTAGITVEDNVPPVAICQNLTIQLSAGTNNGDGAASITAQQVDNGSSDNCTVASLALDNTNFDCADVSTSPNTVTLTVTDVNGNQSTCTAGITVEDNVPPVALCLDLTIQLSAGTNNGDGAASITPQQVDNGSSDNCSVANLALDNTSFDCSDVSTSPNTVTLTVTDVNGNQSTCTAGITVEDNVPPVALCQNLTIQLSSGTNNGDGAASITPQQVDNGSSDNCSVANLALDNTSFDCSDVSTSPNTVTLTVTDVNGNQSTCTAGITVEDNVPPVALCQNLTIQLSAGTNNGDGAASITPQQVDNGSSDNCSVANLSLDNTSFDCSDVSTSPNTVTLTVTDVNGNQSTCTAGITVQDNVPPVALCQNVTVQLNASGNGSITPQQVNNGSSDNCTVASLSLDQTTFNCSNVVSGSGPQGDLFISEYIEGSGNNKCIEIYNGTGAAVNLSGYSLLTYFNGSGSIGSTIALSGTVNNGDVFVVCNSLAGAPFLAQADQTTPGSGTASLTHNGNDAIVLTHNGTPIDIFGRIGENPGTAWTQGGNSTVDHTLVRVPSVTAGNTSNTSLFPALGTEWTQFPNNTATQLGSHTANSSNNNSNGPTVTLTVTDVNGNQSTCTATVTVLDQVPPVALCQNVTVQLDANGNGSTTASAVNNGSNDACGIQSLSLSQTSFTCSSVGANPVTLTVTDNNGNVSICSANVQVQDNVPPVALCQNVTVQLNASGNGNTTASAVNNGSNDACGIQSLSLSQTSFNCSNVGANPVTLTVTDNNGNVSTCSANVQVEDNVPPVALCQDVTVQLDANGNGSTTANAINNGSNDACGIQSLSISNSTFDCSNVSALLQTSSLIISEYVEGSGLTKYVEIYNGTGSAVNLANYSLRLYANGSATPTTVSSLAAGGTLASGQTVVFANSGATAYTGTSFPIAAVNWNGNDAFDLFNTLTSQQVDIFGQIGFDPGTQWSVGGNVTADQTLRRRSNVSSGNTVNGAGFPTLGTEWNSFANNTVSGLGTHSLTNNVVLTVTDNNGNQSTCTAGVTVEDNIAPVALCQDLTIQLNAGTNNGDGSASITPQQVDNGSNDACGIESLALNNTSFSCADVSTSPNTVTLTVTDVNGNQSTCTAGITVEDNVPPVALCQDLTIQLSAGTNNGDGAASITPQQVDNGSSDNCSVANLALDNTSFDCSDVSTSPNTVTLTVTDVNGNQSTCTAGITVEDNVPPVALCQDLTIQLSAGTNNGDGAASITPQQVDNGSSDNCTVASLALNNTSFSCADVSTSPNTVTLTVTDVNGNQTTCTAGITVEDNVPPVALCQDLTIQLSAGTNNGDGSASITPQQVDNGSSDNCTVASLALDNTSFSCSDVSTSPNTVALTVTDVNGNQSTCTTGITVEDNVPPVALCQDLTIQLSAGTNNGDGAASITPQQVDNGSSDNCSVANLALDNTSFDCSDVSTSPNTVTLTVTDVNGNQSTCTAGITVEDNVPPVAICQDLTIQLSAGTNNGDGAASITPQQVDNGSSDNCTVASLALDNTSFDCSDVSTSPNTVTLTVTDVNGNQSTCTAGITVEDNVPPVALCQDLTINTDSTGLVAITPQQIDNGSSDNCTVASLAVNPNTFDCNDKGQNPVVLTVTDVNGNVSTCNATVTVTNDPLVCSTASPTFACGYNISCNGQTDGQATVSVTGGCLPYTYLWTDGQLTSTAINLAAGTYSVTVTDGVGDQTTCTITLTEPAQLVDGFSIPTFACGYNVSCNGASDGSIDYSLSGGCQPYTYSWTGPNGYTFSGQDPQNITAGTYNVTATDQNGCFVTNSFTLTEPALLNGSSVIPTYACGYNISCNGNSDGSIDYSMTGGCQPYSYSWSGPNGFTATSQDISNLVAGTYNVTTTDANGCSLTESFTLTQPAVMQITSLVPSVFAGGYNIGCNGGANGKITVNIAGGASCQAYTVTLSGPVSGTQTGGTPRIFTGLTAGTYTVTVTDANGCTDVSTITLTQAPPLSVDAGVDRLVILNTPFLCPTITAIPTGGVAPYSYYWFRLPSPLPFLNGQTMIDCPTTTTTYVVRIKDANSCVAFDTVVVNVIQRNAVGNPDCDTLGFKFCFFETCTDTCIRTGNVIDSLASYTIQGNCLGDCDNCGPCANQGSKVAMPEEDGQGNSAASAEFLTGEPTFEAFPNPFEEKTTLRFTLPKADQVTVLVFDLRGELVGTLFDGQVEANERTEVTFQPEHVTEGVYISKLVTGSGAVFYRKLILVR